MRFNTLEKIHGCLVFLIGLILLALHTYSNDIFLVDAISISLLVLLILIPYLKYVTKISIQGNSLELEREVKETSEGIEELVDEGQVKRVQDVNEQFNAFVKLIEEIMHKDPNAAIMKLKTELEIAIKQVHSLVSTNKKKYVTMHKMVQELYNKKIIDTEAKEVTMEFIPIANKIVHGELIKEEYSLDIINSALRLIAFYYNKFFTLQSSNQ